MDEIDCAVIGAGVVGLAVARALAMQGREVMLLESENAFGTGISSRNSEVIHAGIYYAAESLKARLCVEGKALLYDYLGTRGVPYRRCGKLIVATADDQVAGLASIAARGAANGVDDLRLLTGAEAVAMEPALRCLAALHSPSTGIVDSHALMLSLLGDFENAGGVMARKSAVARAECGTDTIVLVTEDGTELRCRNVVNAAGLGAIALARRFEGLNPSAIPPPHFAKGSYFILSGRAPFTRLIYPVPEPGGLGVHLTLDLGSQAKFGPDVEWVESAEDLVVDAARGNDFYSEVRKYWPALPDGALVPGYAGIRPKISGPGETAADFVIDGPDAHGVPGLVNLFGIESPGLTSCLAIARYVEGLLD